MSLDSTPEPITIPLSQEQFTVIDTIDRDLVQFNWHAQFRKDYAEGGKYIAARNVSHSDGKRRLELMHRVILSRILGRALLRRERVDHVDRNPLNNRRDNLRLSTPSQNAANSPKRVNNTSGYKGVYFRKDKQKWTAVIWKDGKQNYLGLFITPEEAHKAYDQASKDKFGEFSNSG